MNRRLRIACVMAAAVLAACSSNPKKDVAPLPELSGKVVKLDSRWSVSVGDGSDKEAVQLEPAVLAPAVFAASRDGVVKAVGRATGKLRWKRDFKEGITGGVGAGDGVVALGTAQAELLLLDARDGKTLWRAPLGAALLSVPRITANEVVVQTLDGKLQVFERADGKRRWQFDTPVPPLSLRGNASPVVSGDKMFAVSGQGDLYQIDLKSGLPVWQTRVTNSRGRGEIERLMDIDGDLVLDTNGTLYTAGYQSQLTATDTIGVRRRWQVNISTTQSVGLDAAHVYAVDIDGSMAAIHRITGAIVWRQDGLKGRKLLTPVVWRGLVVVGDSEGWLHLFSPVDGSPRGRERAARGPLMSVVVDAPQLLTLTTKGRLRAWDLNP